jgi:hypothetical protein
MPLEIESLDVIDHGQLVIYFTDGTHAVITAVKLAECQRTARFRRHGRAYSVGSECLQIAVLPDASHKPASVAGFRSGGDDGNGGISRTGGGCATVLTPFSTRECTDPNPSAHIQEVYGVAQQTVPVNQSEKDRRQQCVRRIESHKQTGHSEHPSKSESFTF